MEKPKRITLQFRSNPKLITAYDFDTIVFSDGLLVVSSLGKEEKYKLSDLIKFTVW